MKKAIVFGANGYIGRHLVQSLFKGGFSTIAIDIQDEFMDSSVEYIQIDISNSENLKPINWNVDYIFIFSGITGTFNGFQQYNQFIDVNEIGLLNILTEIRNSEYCPHIVYPSTRLVYKGSNKALKEEDVKDPKTIYAINKITCENILKVYSNSFKIPYTIYRICVPYGNNFSADYSYGTIGNFLNQAFKNKKINLYGDGSQRRTFTHVVDICEQIISTCNKTNSRNEIFNIIGEDYSLAEIASLIAKKQDIHVTFSEWPKQALLIESGDTVFNSEKIETIMDLNLKFTLRKWLDHL